MADLSSETLHASCVAIDGRALLISGRSGSGKSDLALRLIDRGAVLVSDDYTRVTRSGPRLHARAPDTIIGRIEVRGVGIIEMPHIQDVPVALLLRLEERPERLPASYDTQRIAGVDVPVTAFAALEPSAPIKAELALRHVETQR
ncbi:HPr kinase/phosphatase C-terminal domain-containing protein [Stakelama sp. CBK3Z-3]|uniref:HPr kinase/phosphatase C-terminal domain-containing protein n=1 Tax=Stakelama flava TaxID=2860338 RepID=A0ABS6XL27_9SPHN|nr:HPr kinase/phosphatase C-terminal domain-containing protein [Stakelama flava]MBW4330908.1 HPr kinase/phosphatase C-terminal domain-containing protein [Stakelama flava]